MDRFIKILLLGVSLVCGIFHSAHAQPVMPEAAEIPTEGLPGFKLDTLARTYIWFRHDVGYVDSNYMDNRASLASIREALSGIDKDSLNAISSILVEGASSPLGQEIYNVQLSYRRAQTVEKFLRSIPNIGGGKVDIRLVAKGEDWESFTEDIRENYQRRNRKELLELLESDLPNHEKKTRLRTMEPDSLTWRILIRDNMNTSRHAVTIVVVKKKRIIDFLPRLSPITGKVEAVEHPVIRREELPPMPEDNEPARPEDAEQKPLLFALRSNLLVPGLNFGAEYPIGTNWSVGADYYFPWFKRNPDNRNCFQLLGWNVEGRYWFGKDRTAADVLKGHSVGLSTAAGYYDIEREFKGNQGTFVSVGADYLYSLPLFNDKIHFEFTVGLGYLFSNMRPYDVFESGGKAYKVDYTKDIHWVGPTKAAVSIVVPIRPDMFKWLRRDGR